MPDRKDIVAARRRMESALDAKPDMARSSAETSAVITDGFRCEINDGDWKLIADLPAAMGGKNGGPTPGTLGRGALASCLAMGIKAFAADFGVDLNSVRVTADADWDMRGELGVSTEVRPGYEAMRLTVEIDSGADAEAIQSIVDKAVQHSPYLDNFRNKVDVTLNVTRS